MAELLRSQTHDRQVRGSGSNRGTPLGGTDDRQKRETRVYHFMLVVAQYYLVLLPIYSKSDLSHSNEG